MPGLKMLAGIALLAAAFALPVGEARAQGAWCAYAGGSIGYENCGYYTLRQCLAAVSGVGGACMPNPRGGRGGYEERGGYYDEDVPPPPSRRARRPYY